MATGWTASSLLAPLKTAGPQFDFSTHRVSLVPESTTPPVTPNPTPANTVSGQDLISNLMANIFGSNYSSLLNTNAQGGLTPDMLNAIANLTNSRAYTSNVQMRQNLATQQAGSARWLAERNAYASSLPGTSFTGGIGRPAGSSAEQLHSQAWDQQAFNDQQSRVASYAMLSPVNPPAAVRSAGATTPWGAISGWSSSPYSQRSLWGVGG